MGHQYEEQGRRVQVSYHDLSGGSQLILWQGCQLVPLRVVRVRTVHPHCHPLTEITGRQRRQDMVVWWSAAQHSPTR